MMPSWVKAGAVEEIEPEVLNRFDYGHRSFVIYRTADDRFFATIIE